METALGKESSIYDLLGPFQCQGTKMDLLQLDPLMLGVAAGSAVPLVSLNAVGQVEQGRHEPGQREPRRGGSGLHL